MTRQLNARGELTEAGLQAGIIRAARQLGYLVYHTWTSLHSAKGFPDLVLVGVGIRKGRIIVLEVKGEKGRVSNEQREWLDALSDCQGIIVRVVRPSNWDEVLTLMEDM